MGSYGEAVRGTLLVANCPNQDLAKTNLVFLNPLERLAAVPFVEIATCVFTTAADERMAAGSIGLNGVQRKFLRLSTGDPMPVAAFQPPRSGFDIVLMNAEVDFVTKKASNKAEFDATELSAHIQSRFVGQIFTVDQALTFEYQGNNYLLRVSGVLVVDSKGEQRAEARGQLAASTAFVFETAAGSGVKVSGQRSVVAPQLFKHKEFNFEKLGIGGLDAQFEQIFRRAFASRVFPPSVVERLGIRHVKGVLLHGPPGTGKTLIARQIGKMLNGKEPKVVNGPEVLNKYVGASEENIRNLFKEADADQANLGDASELHVIIFDEIDAICKSRGSVRDGSGVHDTVVNQLLTKIDGVDALNNILLIGMTNRKDMLDEALLRPGRLEVHVEIGLPDDKGRLQILQIHTSKMATNQFLGRDIDLWSLAERTKNFSGAEIEGLVKSATSFALNRQVDVNDLSKPINEDNIKVTMEDFERALREIKPAFGAVTETLAAYRLNGMIESGLRHRDMLSTCKRLVEQVRNSEKTPLLTCLLEGPPGAGKTALAATIGMDSDFPFVKVVSADNMVGFGEQAKASQIAKVFEDAYRSPLSIIVLDDIERLLEYVAIGPRFSNAVLQTLLVLLKKQPPPGRKLLILGTTSVADVMNEMEVVSAFNVVTHVPRLKPQEVATVLLALDAFNPQEVDLAVASLLEKEIPIKRLLLLVEMARQDVPEGQRIPLPAWSKLIGDMA
ncbi:hypothetical protein WJX72_011798 [[Myrmecia] bisecta]|uniref:Vesicle-fusing ATPase n=1 Tax=[Myrmecia] bisecta TaxID=41462 RepID=A0AAW1PXZ1_9CHLO